MSRPIKRILAGVGGLLLGLSTPLLAVPSYAPALEPNQANAHSSQQLSEQQLLQLARAITVKVLSEQGWGSGILVEKQGASYKVLTNDHVLGRDRSRGWQIQTPDGKIHRGELVRTVRLNNYDLGLVSFRSSRVYSIADLANVDDLTIGDEVFAAGFPYDGDRPTEQGFTFTLGKVSLLSDKSFSGGYQIGYTNKIKNGMSGGPLLNRQGKVIGINGIHAYPLWGKSYVFADGTVTSPALWEQMSRLSWAIPIGTFLQSGSSSPSASSRQRPAVSPPSLPTHREPTFWEDFPSPSSSTPREKNPAPTPLW
ncbi:S1 family peptidase [Microcystis aeruginosa]|uniref:S1 family peptidase n=1 Tax=Microcystis aeruginosa TaxID=1126 RepID=UPI00232EB278|nr:serine protease [Microcystis aeruginosa]MDB9415285.1 serine protease [Microcystis aeruginosa CS-556/03]